MSYMDQPDEVWLRLHAAARGEPHGSAEELVQFAHEISQHGTSVAAARFSEIEDHVEDCAKCQSDLRIALQTLARLRPSGNRLADQLRSGLRSTWQLLLPRPESPRPLPVFLSPGNESEPERFGYTDTDPSTGWKLRRVAVPDGDSYQIEVAVTDADGRAVSTVSVRLSVASEAEARQAITDAEGIATFADVPDWALATATLAVEDTRFSRDRPEVEA